MVDNVASAQTAKANRAITRSLSLNMLALSSSRIVCAHGADAVKQAAQSPSRRALSFVDSTPRTVAISMATMIHKLDQRSVRLDVHAEVWIFSFLHNAPTTGKQTKTQPVTHLLRDSAFGGCKKRRLHS